MLSKPPGAAEIHSAARRIGSSTTTVTKVKRRALPNLLRLRPCVYARHEERHDDFIEPVWKAINPPANRLGAISGNTKRRSPSDGAGAGATGRGKASIILFLMRPHLLRLKWSSLKLSDKRFFFPG